jgi:hypothetical protein
VINRLCSGVCAAVFLLLCVVVPARAQTPDKLTVSNPVWIDSAKQVEKNFSGNWPYSCAPVPLGHELDVVQKKLLIKLKKAAEPCGPKVASWEYVLPLTQYPVGLYNVTARLDEVSIYSTAVRVVTAYNTFYAFQDIGADLRVAGQRLLMNPGVAGAEQFIQVFTIESPCKGFTISPKVALNGSAVEVNLNFNLINSICGTVPPRTDPRARLVSLGKLAAGSYDVKVTASASLGSSLESSIILQERLIVNPGAPAATASLNGAWYNPTEPGSGLLITESNNTVFVAWFAYAGSGTEDGKPYWFTMTGKRDGAVVRGDIEAPARGTAFGYDWNPADYISLKVGEAVITVRDADQATVTLAFGNSTANISDVSNGVVNPTVTTRNITRLKF